MHRGQVLATFVALAAIAAGGWYYLNNNREPTTPQQLLAVLDATQINCNEFGSEAQSMLGGSIAILDDHVCFEQSGFSSEASIERDLTEAGYTLERPWELGVALFVGHDQGVVVVHIGNGFGVLAVQGMGL